MKSSRSFCRCSFATSPSAFEDFDGDGPLPEQVLRRDTRSRIHLHRRRTRPRISPRSSCRRARAGPSFRRRGFSHAYPKRFFRNRRDARHRCLTWAAPMTEIDLRGADALFRLCRTAPTAGLDDRTWRDLGMDAVFAQIDRCRSVLGRQVLYRRLRTPLLLGSNRSSPSNDASRPSRAIQRCDLRLGRVLATLGDAGAQSLAHIIYGPPPTLPRGASFFPFATLATVIALAASVVQPIALLVALACIVTNIAIRVRRVPGARFACRGRATGGEARRRGEAALEDRSAGPRCAPRSDEGDARARSDARVARSRSSAARGDPGDDRGVRERVLVARRECVRERGAENARDGAGALATMFESVGEIDEAISVAEWRSRARGGVTRPSLEGDAFEVRDLRHPLVDDAVPNDVHLARSRLSRHGLQHGGKIDVFEGGGVAGGAGADDVHVSTSRSYRAPFVQRADAGRREGRRALRAESLSRSKRRRRFRCSKRRKREPLPVRGRRALSRHEHPTIASRRARRACVRCIGAGAFVLAATHDHELLASSRCRARAALLHGVRIDASGLSFDYRLHAQARRPHAMRWPSSGAGRLPGRGAGGRPRSLS